MKNLIFFGLLVFSAAVQAAPIPLGGLKEMSEAVQQISTEEEIKIGRDVAANIIAQFDPKPPAPPMPTFFDCTSAS